MEVQVCGEDYFTILIILWAAVISLSWTITYLGASLLQHDRSVFPGLQCIEILGGHFYVCIFDSGFNPLANVGVARTQASSCNS